MMKQFFCAVAVALLCISCSSPKQKAEQDMFVSVKNGQFIRNGKPYYYVGANFWYGAILGSEGTGGNRKRLCQELDSLKALGVNNLRVLVGADGKSGVPTKVEPTLQTAPGVYNDTILAGLDYLLMEMGKRDMLAVLYLNNSWEWSGGYGQYLEWAGFGKIPVPAIDGYEAFMNYVKQFPQSEVAKRLFSNYVNDIVTRTNRYTGKRYTDDPTIMSWQIGNEPRAFSQDNKEAFADWLEKAATQLDSLAPRQLISTGSEGKAGCEEDISLFERIHQNEHIDYLTIHIWPYNWGWVSEDSLQQKLDNAKQKTEKYITEHLSVAERCGKPMVIEEFGYPRDGFKFEKHAPTVARDSYYESVFGLINKHARTGGLLAGCNFWAWGGSASLPTGHDYWKPGDDYTGDPAQEAQGLNSVFSTDSTTLSLIRNINAILSCSDESY